MNKTHTFALGSLFFAVFLFVGPLYAAEGDFELGGGPVFVFVPSADMYGGGVELFGRYALTDSVQLGLSTYLTGHSMRKLGRAGLFHIRAGALYNLDIIAWVPYAGAYISALFSDHSAFRWRKKHWGLGLDLEVGVAYKGYRPLSFALALAYHMVFTEIRNMPDFFSLAFTISWTSDNF